MEDGLLLVLDITMSLTTAVIYYSLIQRVIPAHVYSRFTSYSLESPHHVYMMFKWQAL